MARNPIERAPVASMDARTPDKRFEMSLAGFERTLTHFRVLTDYLQPGRIWQRKLSEKALDSYKRLKDGALSGEESTRGRPIQQIAMHMDVSNRDVINECRGKSVLDIGCGEGRFGQELRYSGAKAEITLVERDKDLMARVSDKIGRKVVADACSLPFGNDSFDRTFMTYSAITYADSPIAAVQALNEAVRVTKKGGSTFLLPFCNEMTSADMSMATGLYLGIEGCDYETAEDYFNVQAVTDYLVIRSLLRLIVEKKAEITWFNAHGLLQNGKGETEVLSAIVDKVDDVPGELLESNIKAARTFCDF